VSSLFEDSQGDIWVGTQGGGLCLYKTKQDKFIQFNVSGSANRSIASNEVFDIEEDEYGNIWIGAQHNLTIIKPDTYDSYHFKIDSGGKDPRPLTALKIYKDSKNRMWLGTWIGGLFEASIEADKDLMSFSCKHAPILNNNAQFHIWEIKEFNQNELYLGSFIDGLFVINTEVWPPVVKHHIDSGNSEKSISMEKVTFIEKDNSEKLLIGTLRGLNRLDPKAIGTDRLLVDKYFLDYQTSDGFTSSEFWGSYKDKDKNIWICTSNGLNLLKSNSTNFNKVYPFQNLNNSGTTTSIIETGQNKYLIGTIINGLIQYEDNKITKHITEIDQISTNQITGIIPLSENTYIFSSLTDLFIIDVITNKIEHQDFINLNKKNLQIRHIALTSDESVSISTNEGLYIANLTSKTITNFNNASVFKILSNDIFGSEQGSDGGLWIASYSGLNRIEKNANNEYSINSYVYKKNDPSSIINNRVTTLEDTPSGMWIGTESGLCFFNYETKSIERKNPIGTEFSVIKSIIATTENTIWLTSNRSIFRYNVSKNISTEYSVEEGLHKGGFFRSSNYKSEDGDIIFAGDSGFTYFSPNSIDINKQIPETYITDIYSGSKLLELNSNSIYTTDIELAYNDNNISFDFASLNLILPQKNKYKYKLENFDSEWIYTKNKNANYTNLDPGNYIFKVQGSNNDGLWSDKPAHINITVKPPFHKSTLFYLLLISGILLCLYQFVYLKIKHSQEKAKTLERYNSKLNSEILNRIAVEQSLIENQMELGKTVELLKESNYDLTQFAHAASHDLKSPLRTIGSFIGLLKSKYAASYDKKADEYFNYIEGSLKRMSNLITSLLQFSKIDTAIIKFQYFDPTLVIEDRLMDLDTLIQEKNAIIHLPKEKIKIWGAANEFGMIVYNLINNGLKYNKSEQAHIHITYSETNKFWNFSVSDNGIGIDSKYQDKIFGMFHRLHSDKEYEGSGIGLSTVLRIIKKHGGDVHVDSTIGKGSTFYFSIKKPDGDSQEIILKEEKSYA